MAPISKASVKSKKVIKKSLLVNKNRETDKIP